MARDQGGGHGHPDYCGGSCGLCHCEKAKRGGAPGVCANKGCGKNIAGLKYRGQFRGRVNRRGISEPEEALV